MSDEHNGWMWVLIGEGGTHPMGLFTSSDKAEQWIAQHEITGILTRYPIDTPLIEWAQQRGFFTPTSPNHRSARYKQRFSSAYLEHFHYVNGQPVA